MPAKQTTEHSQAVPKQRIAANRRHKVLDAYDIPEGFHACFVNDDSNGNNIKEYLRAGYNFVSKTEGKIDNGTVHESHSRTEHVQKHVGGGVTAYLMIIPQELYEQDVEVPATLSREKLKDVTKKVPPGQEYLSFSRK